MRFLAGSGRESRRSASSGNVSGPSRASSVADKSCPTRQAMERRPHVRHNGLADTLFSCLIIQIDQAFFCLACRIKHYFDARFDCWTVRPGESRCLVRVVSRLSSLGDRMEQAFSVVYCDRTMAWPRRRAVSPCAVSTVHRVLRQASVTGRQPGGVDGSVEVRILLSCRG